MAVNKLIGIEDIDYNKKDGTHVSGKKIYVTRPIKNGSGDMAEEVYVSERMLRELKITFQIGQMLNIFYDSKGRLEEISLSDQIDY